MFAHDHTWSKKVLLTCFLVEELGLWREKVSSHLQPSWSWPLVKWTICALDLDLDSFSTQKEKICSIVHKYEEK
jgi:hypothetical protein